GGTVSGVGRALREHKPGVTVVGVEPAGSPLLTEGRAGPHKIQGIGANFIPENLDRDILSRVVTVTDDEAATATRQLAVTEGILVGISSGAALAAAVRIAKESEHAAKQIVVLLPDTGERYLSTGLFQNIQ
ncbi:MAG: pyridoxal-phosphate dependent enzyme, partial [Angelakisella sp.]